MYPEVGGVKTCSDIRKLIDPGDSGEKPCAYSEFRKCLGSALGLGKHAVAHTGERPNSCQHCGGGFKSKAYLRSHIVSHGEGSPFVCSYCGKRCKRKSDLNGHIKHCHTDEGPRHVDNHCSKRLMQDTGAGGTQ